MVRNASPGTSCLLATVYLHRAGLIWLHRKRGNHRHDRENPIIYPVVQCLLTGWGTNHYKWIPVGVYMSKVKPAHNTCIAVACSIVFRMVHPCIVPGCTNRSNKEECKNIKFYTLPFNDEWLLQIWLTLVCRRREEVTVHSRICSTHFANGIKKSNKDLTSNISLAEVHFADGT